jgi:hypothetical protein
VSIPHALSARLEYWRGEGNRLAGGLRDVAQRAVVYRQIFRDSGGNHAFPLIAAHGACWSRGHFAWGDRVGWWLAWRYALGGRARKLAALTAFADVFRDVNRRVCADTYATFHFAREHWHDPHAGRLLPGAMWEQLRKLHAARAEGRAYSDAERRDLFCAHFLYEQEHVVGPALEAAVAAFDWPFAKRVALRPTIRFAFFARGQKMAFGDFSRAEERIANGLRAFEWAAAAGWGAVEEHLRDYGVMPAEAFADPEAAFAEIRATAGGAALSPV